MTRLGLGVFLSLILLPLNQLGTIDNKKQPHPFNVYTAII